MPVVKVQVSIPRDSGITADVSVNDFHFSTINVLQITLDSLAELVNEFYTQADVGGVNALVAYLSAVTNPAGARIRMYNMDEPKPRVPIYDEATNLGIAGGTSLPSEVSLVGSFEAAKTSGLNQARRRGRVYLGPLSDLARDAAGNVGRPSAVAIAALRFSMLKLSQDTKASADMNWVVYSAGARDNSNPAIPYKDRPLLAPSFAEVDNGWVDNAFDTQRRRGEEATSRSTWSTP